MKSAKKQTDRLITMHSQKSWVILLMNIHKPNRVIYDVGKYTLNHIWKNPMMCVKDRKYI